MRRFAIEAAGFLAGLVVLSNLVGRVADHFAPVDPWESFARESFTGLIEDSPNLEAVVLGNSHASAIDFEGMGLIGAAALRPGTDLFEVERTAATLAPEMPKLETAFVPISYFSFNIDNAAIVETQIIRINAYASLPIWRPAKHDMRNLLLGKLQAGMRVMSLARPDSWRGVFEGMRATAGEPRAAGTFTRSEAQMEGCGHPGPEEIAEQSEGRVRSEIERTRAMMAEHDGLVSDSQRALLDTIEVFTRRGVRVVLFTPPYWKDYNALFVAEGGDLIQTMHESLESLSDLAVFEYYDLSTRDDLNGRIDFFKDSDHLNDCGRRAFSQALLAEMTSNIRVRNERKRRARETR